MKLLIFTEGTIMMHPEGVGLSRKEIVRQIRERKIVIDYGAHVPVGNAVRKLNAWQRQGSEIVYLTSRTECAPVDAIRNVLVKYGFPKGELLCRRGGAQYKDVAECVLPDILIEDDCESIGGAAEMTYPPITAELKKRIQSIAVKEFGGIDHLPDHLTELEAYDRSEAPPLVEIKYRPIQPEDYELVRQFLTESGWQNRVQDPIRFKKILERADRTVVVLEDTRVIGFGRALCDGVSNGYLSMIAVAEDKRRQGIGTEIVKRLLADDDAGNVTWVLRAGRGSREFWRKLGFTESQIAMERLRQTPGSS